MDWPIIFSAVLAANIFTAMFLYGVIKGANDAAPAHAWACILIPLGALALGVFIWTGKEPANVIRVERPATTAEAPEPPLQPGETRSLGGGWSIKRLE